MDVNTKYGTIDIAISGLKSQNKYIEIIGSNISNAQTTKTSSGEPYKQIEARFKSTGDKFGTVEVEQTEAEGGFKRVLDPGHPDADEQGYVKMPDINLPSELMKLNTASRAYEANVAVLKRYQKMVERTLELLK